MIVERSLGPLLISPGETIRAALGRINATPYLIQLVIDDAGVLIGSLTDGDIRRGLLKGLDLGSTVESCMFRRPHVARSQAAAVAELSRLVSARPCVPVVDELGRPQYVVTRRPVAGPLRTALVMAGGFGRRLGDITQTTPKPLVPVNGRPILAHLIERLVNAGFSELYISVHYLGEQIAHFVEALRCSAQVHLIREDQPLGTAGALGLLPKEVDGPILMLNGDLLTHADFHAMAELHQGAGNDMTIAAARYEHEVPFGVLHHDPTGELTSIEEKPRHTFSVSAGIYLIEANVRALILPQTRIDMPSLILQAKAAGRRVGVFPLHESWIDVGRPEDIQRAERLPVEPP